MDKDSCERLTASPLEAPDSPMLHLMWNSQFETGIDVIDRQHRCLVDRVNQMAPLLAKAGAQVPEGVAELFDHLKAYVEVHFATEEHLMSSWGVDPRHIARQHESHRRFSAEVTKFTAAYLNRRGISGRELLGFLTNWLVFHILGEDQVLAQQLHSIGEGMAPQVAFETASNHAIDPARQALSHVLSDMYAQFSNMAGQHEANIDELELRHKIIAEHTCDWETWHGPEGELRYCSPACLRISGYAAKLYLADANLLRSIAHPEDALLLDGRLTEGYANTGWCQTVFRIRHADGSWRWLEHDCQPVFDDIGHFQGRRASIRDVTDRVEMAQQLRDALSRAEKAAKVKSEFLSNMSHEIRTPLSAIIASSLLMQKDSHEPEQYKRLQRIVSASHHLLALISDILDMAKIEAGKIEVETSPFLLANVVDMVTNQMDERLRDKALEWHVEIDSALAPCLLGDPLRLGQILLNFAGNAVKFTESGGVTLMVQHLGESLNGQHIRFAVRDTGCGFDPSKAAHIFEPFEQEDGSTTRKYGGTGLGLAICRQLASLMGGSVGAESHPGRGSTFWFEVTLTPAIDPDQRGAYESLKGRRAILIGREELAMGQTREALELQGVHVHQAETVADLLMRVEVATEVGRPYDFMICVGYGSFLFELLEAQSFARRSSISNEQQRSCWLWVCRSDDMSALNGKLHFFDQVLPLTDTANELSMALLGMFAAKKAETHRTQFQASDSAPGKTPDFSCYAQCKILLVEDNPINRDVMLDVLGAVALQADVAEDGRAALSRVVEKSYDLILMDMQMPVMGGVEAAQAIRHLAGYQHTPILALTANAFESDRKACLAAGMNDHLVKPVLPDVLYAALQQWLPLPTLGAAKMALPLQINQESEDVVSKIPEIALPEITGLNVTAGLNYVRGKRAFYRRCLDLLVRDHSQDSAAIREDIAQGRFLQARRRAHSLKGASSMLGAEAIQFSAEELEKMLNSQASIDMLELELKNLADALADLSQALAAITPATQDQSQ